jgi:hypothetical protein
LAWNCTCFGQFVCTTSGGYSLYTQQWYMSNRFVDNFRTGPGWNSSEFHPVWHIPLLSVQWITSWWCTDELSETCRVSCQNKLVKLVYLVGFIIKKLFSLRRHSSFIVHSSQFHSGPARKLSTNLYDIYHCWVYSE